MSALKNWVYDDPLSEIPLLRLRQPMDDVVSCSLCLEDKEQLNRIEMLLNALVDKS
jgi:hypothetical protein